MARTLLLQGVLGGLKTMIGGRIGAYTAMCEQARQSHTLRWSRTTRYWHQPELAWIKPPPIESGAPAATLMMVP
jgi:hypothetical protein